ncbi:hypothetical protein [Burkholderia sp. Ac-20365]|uniref:hypothetical protein n=1 Tax=Burkholderia sp. Ac-20365 TaxID=2703897 RepID=UPI00197C785E|nr:hypothetical protein [Burkholderia sp. Ac-20365]MBN3760985.1 hypothetical protein [Burkholderia sp. Ac-20365]
MFESGSNAQTPPCAVVGVGGFATRIADELFRLAPAGELARRSPENASTAGVDANVTFVLWNGEDPAAGEVAARVEKRVRATGALAAGVRVFSSERARPPVADGHDKSSLRIDLVRDGLEHKIACLVGGFAGAMGERGVIGVDLADVREALEHADNVTYISVGYSAGVMRAQEATHRALQELNRAGVRPISATGIFVLIAGASIRPTEMRDVTNVVRTAAGGQTHVYPGAYRDDRLGRLLRITLVVSVPTEAR